MQDAKACWYPASHLLVAVRLLDYFYMPYEFAVHAERADVARTILEDLKGGGLFCGFTMPAVVLNLSATVSVQQHVKEASRVWRGLMVSKTWCLRWLVFE